MFLTLRFTNRSAIDETRPVLTVPWAAPHRILAEVRQIVASGRLWKFPEHTFDFCHEVLMLFRNRPSDRGFGLLRKRYGHDRLHNQGEDQRSGAHRLVSNTPPSPQPKIYDTADEARGGGF